MRDNIKPIEAGFFKYCMKNLSHEYYYRCDAITRDDRFMWDLMRDYSTANDIPFKVIIGIVNKWDTNGIFEWGGDIWGTFHVLNFPLEYIMLIPRRVLRKVPAFGFAMTTTRAADYGLAFTFKTKANKLTDTGAINETSQDYWNIFEYNPEKYKNAIRYINKTIDGSMIYSKSLLIAYVKYVMDTYDIDNFDYNNIIINSTILALKRYVRFAKENNAVKRDACLASHDNFIYEVSDFIINIFNEINC